VTGAGSGLFGHGLHERLLSMAHDSSVSHEELRRGLDGAMEHLGRRGLVPGSVLAMEDAGFREELNKMRGEVSVQGGRLDVCERENARWSEWANAVDGVVRELRGKAQEELNTSVVRGEVMRILETSGLEGLASPIGLRGMASGVSSGMNPVSQIQTQERLLQLEKEVQSMSGREMSVGGLSGDLKHLEGRLNQVVLDIQHRVSNLESHGPPSMMSRELSPATPIPPNAASVYHTSPDSSRGGRGSQEVQHLKLLRMFEALAEKVDVLKDLSEDTVLAIEDARKLAQEAKRESKKAKAEAMNAVQAASEAREAAAMSTANADEIREAFARRISEAEKASKDAAASFSGSMEVCLLGGR